MPTEDILRLYKPKKMFVFYIDFNFKRTVL